ncbi:MAG: response regulator [Lachnospiraceae bacterium]|nr:response regulator [Lachnospiraceae bacterium]
MRKPGVILVCVHKSFMIHSIENHLDRNGYRVVQVTPEVRKIDGIKDESDIILVYLDSMMEYLPKLEDYLKGICVGEEKSLILIGDHMELQNADSYFPPGIVSAKLERPLDMNRMMNIIMKIEYQNKEGTRRKSIMIVDDDIAFLKMLNEWLSEKYQVTMSTTGMQALTYLAKNSVDLILLDYEMPLLDGPSVLAMLRNEPTTVNIPVMFLTGKDDRNSVIQVMSLKPEGYLLKSMERERILNSIEEFFTMQKTARVDS